ncbi:MAG: phage holin family protein [Gemmatimonadetes bacterium]|jgi:putative membrane protein|nr:phage holin family protein [Gemmatimonadota bacterium]MBK6455203.1 phage holin family protein [Gemmatimonadota bacterium]MBK9979414.1 phage holin family protein [Gemmatimonadota bacterium]HNV75976.1 phage holin family protein [Gemmatimonadaceae bacterium]HPV74154.1 phage holin family protein [Gemmatimonadaceae bacterium]
MSLILRLLVNAAALYVATRVVDGISFTGSPAALLGVALVFGIVNTLVKPIVQFFSFPFIIVTLGLFLLCINAVMLLVTSSLSQSLGLGFTVRGFAAALIGSIVVSLTSLVLGQFVEQEKKD